MVVTEAPAAAEDSAADDGAISRSLSDLEDFCCTGSLCKTSMAFSTSSAAVSALGDLPDSPLANSEVFSPSSSACNLAFFGSETAASPL